MQTYHEKLKVKDPRWQKKRLEILERDEFCCQICGNNEQTLIVHHRYYLFKNEPWDYNNNCFVSLCEDCHNFERETRKDYEKQLLEVLKLNFFSDDLSSLVDGFYKIQMVHSGKVVASMLKWVLLNKKIQKELMKRYFEDLKNGKSST